jgi:hypothetical protein
MQGFFFGVILREDGGIVSDKGDNTMQSIADSIAFIGYFALMLYYLIHLLK